MAARDKKIQIRMSEEEFDKLKKLADADDRTVSDYIRVLIKRLFNETK